MWEPADQYRRKERQEANALSSAAAEGGRLRRMVSADLQNYHLQASRTGLMASLMPLISNVVIWGDELKGVNSKSKIEPPINFFN